MTTGPDEEFDGFMRGRWPSMVRLAYALTGDAGHAEDLAQAAFARAYASWSRVRRAGDPDAYVRRIVINAHRSGFRKRRVTEELRGDLPDIASPSQPGAGESSELLDALSALAPRQRAVVVLRYWLDLSEAETAAALGCSVGTVKSQASRALATLRKTTSGLHEPAVPGPSGAAGAPTEQDIIEGGLR